MARENFYDVALKKSAVGEMTKDIFYGFDAAEWFLTADDGFHAQTSDRRSRSGSGNR